jgi:hypothetical protein
MRHRRGALALAVLLLVVLVAVLAVTRGGSGAPGATPVAQAAYLTSRSPGFRFSMTVSVSVAGHSFTLDGGGALDERDREGSMSFYVAGRSIAEIIKSPYVYVKVPPDASSALAGGKEWIGVNLDAYSQAFGVSSPLSGSSAGPTELVGFLRSSGAVKTLGEETIRGVDTTHYHVLADLARYAATLPAAKHASARATAQLLKHVTGSSTLPLDAWIDGQGRLRRVASQLELCTPVGRLLESFSVDLYDFGRQPPVHAPDASRVSDMTAKVQSQASRALSRFACKP